MRQRASFEGAFTRGDPDIPYRYLPFEMPPGAQRLEVSYHFERPEDGDGDVVDIGVFDARGTGFLTGGFRGWSGSARGSFFISASDATPGYVRGPLMPGQWNLILGCPLKSLERCRYWVQLSLDIDPNAGATAAEPESAPSPAVRPRRARGGSARWYRGDFHSHSVHSDGRNTLDECAAAAQRLGLDFLAITDHNTSSHFEAIAARPDDGGPLLIPGEEITTSLGHANVWGAGCWVDFRCPDGPAMQRVVDFVYSRGGIFSPNHPKPSAGYPWGYSGVTGYSAVEAWQGVWRYFNTESVEFWEDLLRGGGRVTAIGGSDSHSLPPAAQAQPWTLGNPCTWVYVNGALDEQGVLEAVRSGHVFISEEPAGPFLELTATCGDGHYLMGDAVHEQAGAAVRFHLSYRGPAGKKLRLLRDGEPWQEGVADGEETTLEFEAQLDGPGYVRAEAAGYRGQAERGEVVHAMTNPIYLRTEEE